MRKGTKKSKKNKYLVLTPAVIVAFGAGLVFFYSYSKSGLTFFQFYQNFADPYERYVNISPGLRNEQIADIYGTALSWNDQEKQEFLHPDGASSSADLEGYYFPSTYLVSVNATPEEVSQQMINGLNQDISKETTKASGKVINVDTALKIASIIQREAAGKSDMKLISGIIWNRLFDGMPLEMDATIQYAKGTDGDWWPQVTSADIKDINSPYNTYENKGLPPTPIANPGADAIDAAYNPLQTNDLYYIHDKNHVIHASVTYDEQLANIKKYLD